MDSRNEIAEAIGIRDSIIDMVGDSEEALASATDTTEIVDLRGRTVMPGFFDAHGHYPSSGQKIFSADLNSPPLGLINSIKELQSALTSFSKKREDGWLIGHGYDDSLLEDNRHPTREDLDKVSTKRPIVIWHVSGHLAVLNSRALAILSIDGQTADPEGGRILKELRNGVWRATGVLEETAVSLAHLGRP